MNEIIQLQIGQCGNQIGSNFWKTISDEHGINESGEIIQSYNIHLDRICVYYNESSNKKYVPRAVLIDLEPGTLESIGSGYKCKFSHQNFISGITGAGNNWAKGYNLDGIEMLDRVLNTVRLEAEKCDCLQGFQITHSLGGGTGSGLGSRLMSKIQQIYPKRMISSFSVVPSSKVSDTIVEPYNALMAMEHLICDVQGVHLIDNSALFDVCRCKLNLTSPTYGDLNHLVAQTMSGVTTGFRFSGPGRQQQMIGDLKTLITNMVPLPKLHFFTSGLAPLTYRTQSSRTGLSLEDVVGHLADPKRLLVSCDTGRCLAAALMFRGSNEMCPIEVNKLVYRGLLIDFVEWIPDNVKTFIYRGLPSHGLKVSGTIMTNGTNSKGIFQRVLKLYSRLMSRKAFLHLYTEQGLEINDFQQAEEQIKSLIADYLECEKTSCSSGQN
ncbi:tubulin beta-6 chain-like [Daktulosphaira vitifoliae]|uniref:tubulin beta-6 chain-like n=1 Tax=Daktulosphaira vitifoliae TaxID=58002 RepID=UPI0021A98222|nr:tubulin beta-6 chain-like [Daktulosphaira vitifoliae]